MDYQLAIFPMISKFPCISFLPLFSLFSTIWMAAELCNHWTKWTLEMLPHLKGWFISYYSSHFTGEDRATAVSGPALPITCHPNTLMVSLLVSDYTYILESFLLLPVAALHFHTATWVHYNMLWYDSPYQY